VREALTATVVVCAHTEERWDDLVASLASVAAQDRRPDQVVLVVDHNPALLARAREVFAADVLVVDNHGPRGESGARNAGVAASTGDVVAFLDDDAEAEPGWLAALLDWYADPEVLGVGGAAAPRWDTSRPRWFPREFDWVVGCSYRGLPEGAAPIRNLMGCNMSIRRDVIERAGGFYSGLGRTGDDGFGCSETEFCIRAQRLLGGHFVFEPRARIAHRVPAGRTTWSYFTARCRAEGRSKAHLAGREGADDALALERTYVRRTLPSGVARGLGDFVTRDRAGLSRSLAIVAGAGWTATGYLAGSAGRRRS
jgi:glycosyltransferase involved in cell wall biosynthesis